MTPLLKINNGELCYTLKLNYNNVYSRLRMLLGSKASLFADIAPKSAHTIWYADDDKSYEALSQASPSIQKQVMDILQTRLAEVRKELSKSSELSPYLDELLSYPGLEYVFYRLDGVDCKVILAGWGCKPLRGLKDEGQSSFVKAAKNDTLFRGDDETTQPKPAVNAPFSTILAPDTDSVKKAGLDNNAKDKDGLANPDDNQEPVKPALDKRDVHDKQQTFEKKTCTITVLARNQRRQPLEGEILSVRTSDHEWTVQTDSAGMASVDGLYVRNVFIVSFPDSPSTQEQTFEVESGRDVYEVYVNKLVQYAPMLLVQDQDGLPMSDYKVKVITKGKDNVYTTGSHGMVQLPMMMDGQKFVVTDTRNFANSAEYTVSSDLSNTPLCFKIVVPEKKMVGITVLHKDGKPMLDTLVDIYHQDNLYQKLTDEKGHVSFPCEAFEEGKVNVVLHPNGNNVQTSLSYTDDCSEYTLRLLPGKAFPFNWKWLVLPLVALIAAAAFWLFHKPSLETMEKGVVLVYNKSLFHVDVKLSNGKGVRFYFRENDGNIEGTFDESEKHLYVTQSTGTGFIISKSGQIATNRHVANPLPPEDAPLLLKTYFSRLKNNIDRSLDSLKECPRTQERNRLIGIYKQQIIFLSDLINIGEYHPDCEPESSVAFYGSLVETDADGRFIIGDQFHGCKLLQFGEPGTLERNDVAIIQLNDKERALPEDAYIFNVPQKDIIDKKMPFKKDVTILGYNLGLFMAGTETGIYAQQIEGNLMKTDDEYRLQYNADTQHGSSGGPVLNHRRKLIAVNNSGLSVQSSYAYGIRVKYLNELLEKLQSK